jgi:hypothetical protein
LRIHQEWDLKENFAKSEDNDADMYTKNTSKESFLKHANESETPINDDEDNTEH